MLVVLARSWLKRTCEVCWRKANVSDKVFEISIERLHDNSHSRLIKILLVKGSDFGLWCHYIYIFLSLLSATGERGGDRPYILKLLKIYVNISLCRWSNLKTIKGFIANSSFCFMKGKATVKEILGVFPSEFVELIWK